MKKLKPLSEEESKELSPLTTKIVDALFQKSMCEMRQVNKNNPVYLGGVKFYFMESENGPHLVWDTHISEWNEKEIKEDIDNIEYQIAKERGLI